MAMPLPVHHLDWTVERALAIPDDGNRYEVLDGELFVTPSPSWSHQAAIEALYPRLRAYVRGASLGWAKLSPADLTFSPRRLVQPDLFVVASRGDGAPRRWADVAELLLVVEVVSPSTARADRYRKRSIYMQERVGEYWIVDPGQRLIERWRPGDVEPEILTDVLRWAPRAGVAEFVLDVGAYFDEVFE
jgi:Uma2 family endonuclease